jgi:hypothetical protein
VNWGQCCDHRHRQALSHEAPRQPRALRMSDLTGRQRQLGRTAWAGNRGPSSVSLPLSVQVNTDASEQRIDNAFQLADHRADPPALDQPLPRTRFPDAPALLIRSSYCRGHRIVTQPTPTANMTGPMLGGTSTARLLLITRRARRRALAPTYPDLFDWPRPGAALRSRPLRL